MIKTHYRSKPDYSIGRIEIPAGCKYSQTIYRAEQWSGHLHRVPWSLLPNQPLAAQMWESEKRTL